MTTANDYILMLNTRDAVQQQAARDALLMLDEEAVNPLIEAFHAGVNEVTGVVILDLVGEIGGPDALTLLRYVFNFEEAHTAWYRASAKGLLYNEHSLDTAEREAVRRVCEG